MKPESTVGGVFVGGASRRMGGAPKGLLPSPSTGEPLVVATARDAASVGLHVVLVGEASPYDGLLAGTPRLADSPPGVGPLGGLAALLAYAEGRGAPYVVALACDMPHVTGPSLQRLASAPFDLGALPAAVVAARRSAHAPWEPLFARYDVAAVGPVLTRALGAGVRSFQRLFCELAVAPLVLAPGDLDVLDDWDTPDDVAASRARSRDLP